MDNYTLEEIIAEVKNEKFTDPPAQTDEPEQGALLAREEASALPPDASLQTAEKEQQPDGGPTVSPAPRHMLEEERPRRSRWQKDDAGPDGEDDGEERARRAKIVEFPDITPEPEGPAPEKPRRRLFAPWRTQAPDDWEPEENDEPLPLEEDDEDEPPEPERPYDFSNPAMDDAEQGISYCSSKTASLSARILFMFPLLALSVYMTLAPTLALPLPPGCTYADRPFLYLLVLCAAEICAMLLASDVTGAGFYRLVVLRPTLDSAVLFSCLCTLAHAVSIIVKPEWGGYLPYCCISVLTCMLATIAKRQRAEALKRTYKICQLATAPTAVKRLRAEDGKGFVAVKAQQGAYPDVERIAGMSRTERVATLYSPVAIAACVALAAVASFGQGQGSRFLWALAALASACVPFPLLFASTSPARRVGKKLFTSGAALLGSRGAEKLARCRSAALRDGDLFPAGSVTITGIKLASNRNMEEIIGTAAAVFAACGSGVGKAFDDFARQQYAPQKTASDFRFFETGGLSATVDGHYVLAGSPSFLLRMGVRVTLGSKLADGLFLAIDSAFVGVFTVKYAVQPQVFSAFRVLQRCKLRPLLATLHFGLTQALVEKRFELRRDWAEYPELARRAALAEPECGRSEEPLAVLSRDSTMAFAEAAGGARQLRRAERVGIVIGLISAALGIGLMYFLAASFKVSSATPYNVLLFLLLWQVPALLCGLLITKF